jgi:hypothetical protein
VRVILNALVGANENVSVRVCATATVSVRISSSVSEHVRAHE